MLSISADALKILLCVLGILAPFVKSGEIQDNTLKITFKDITTTKWHNEHKTANFTDVMATVANDYCSKNYDNCSLKFWNTTRVFKNSHIKMSSGYPKQINDDLQINFHILLPSGKDIRKTSTTVLPKAVLATILLTTGSVISLKVGVEVKSDVGGSTSKPKLDNKMNYIMIPVSFGILLFVMVLACGLHLCHKQNVKETKRASRRQQEAESPKPPFSPRVSTSIPEVIIKPQPWHDLEIENEKRNKEIPRSRPNFTTSIPEVSIRPQPRCEAEENGDIITNTSKQYEDKRNTKSRHKTRRNQEENSHINEEYNEQGEEQQSGQGRQHSKHRRKKKKHHKRKDSATLPDDDNDSEREQDCTGITELDISSRLPAPRKLPPLKSEGDDGGHNDR